MADPLARYLKAPVPGKQPKAQEPERQSLMRQIAGGVVSPLAKAANFLDLPGSSVRDVMTGNNPFDQYLTPFQDVNRTTGRDVLSHYGLTTPNDPHRWEMSDVGGFLAEVGLDPLTYLSFGGAAAAKGAASGARNLFRAGIPFTGISKGFTGGKAGQALLKGVDAIKSSVANSSLGRNTAALFDYTVKGARKPMEQKLNRALTAAKESARPVGHMKTWDDLAPVKPLKDAFTEEVGDGFDTVIKHALETGGKLREYGTAFRQAAKRVTGKDITPELEKAAHDALTPLRQRLDETNAAILERGGKSGNVADTDNFSYIWRRISDDYLKARGLERKGDTMFSHAMMKSRSTTTRNIPELFVEEMYQNRKELTGRDGWSKIFQRYGQYLGGFKMKRFNPETGVKELVDITPEMHAKMLKNRLKKMPDGLKSVYDNNPAALHDKYVKSGEYVAKNMDAIHGFIGETASDTGESLAKVYGRLGMDAPRSIEYLAKTLGKSVDEVAKLKVPKDAFDAIVASRKFNQDPEWLGVLGEFADWFNRGFKSNVTLPFPAFHLRNLIGGQINNALSGTMKTFRDVKDYISASRDAMKLWGKPNSREYQELLAYKVLDPYTAFDDVRLPGENAFTGNPFNVKQTWQEAGQHVAENPNLAGISGLDTTRLPGPFQKAVGGLRQTHKTALDTGAKVAGKAEFANRVPMFLYLKKKGFSAEEAAAQVERLQFDYGRSSPFESNVMKRAIPFYTYARRITPLTLEMLAERPGGALAQTFRAAASARDDEDVQPSYIAGTAAIPLGQQPDGSKRYLSGFGLGAEAAMPYLMAGADPGGAALDALSATTPLLKYPLEMATGQTFFQRGVEGGRPLNQLDPNIGRLLSNVGEQMGLREPESGPVEWAGGATRPLEHLIGNTPLTKYISTARTLSDPRKGALAKANNALLPTRVTDVSPQQQERLLQQASNVLADQLGAGTWTNRYFTEKRLNQLESQNPMLAAQARALKKLWSESKKSAKKHSGKTKKARASKEPARASDRLLKLAGV